MRNDYTVYMHIFPNTKKYIGITCKKPKYRWANGRGYQNRQRKMSNAIKKYGWENVEHIILFANLTKEEAEQKEIELIAKYKSNNQKYGYNIANGGNTSGSMSEETKEKIRRANSGRKMSEKTKIKLSKARKGKKFSKEFAQNQSKYMKQQWQDKKYREKMKNRKKGMLNKHHTKEAKEKMREKAIGRKMSEEAKIKLGRKIICVETGIIYDTIHQAGEKLNISYQNIYKCCNKKRNRCGGYHWQYLN